MLISIIYFKKCRLFEISLLHHYTYTYINIFLKNMYVYYKRFFFFERKYLFFFPFIVSHTFCIHFKVYITPKGILVEYFQNISDPETLK